MNDNTKITLTVGQLKRLVQESEKGNQKNALTVRQLKQPIKKVTSNFDAVQLVEKEDYDIVVEMANKYQTETHLPMNIWIDENQAYVLGKHGKRVKFQLDTSTANKSNESGSMDFNGNVYIDKGKKLRLHYSHLNQLRNFIHNNELALDRLADRKIKIIDIWPHMIMGGELATDEQIKALNDKVMEFERAEQEVAKKEQASQRKSMKRRIVKNRQGKKR